MHNVKKEHYVYANNVGRRCMHTHKGPRAGRSGAFLLSPELLGGRKTHIPLTCTLLHRLRGAVTLPVSMHSNSNGPDQTARKGRHILVFAYCVGSKYIPFSHGTALTLIPHVSES